jgi:acyl carrier protein
MTQTHPEKDIDGDQVTSELVAILESLTGDWETGFSGQIGSNTKLIADLGFESIDVVHLIVALEEHFRRNDLPFESLLMNEGRYVQGLQVGEVAVFLSEHVSS